MKQLAVMLLVGIAALMVAIGLLAFPSPVTPVLHRVLMASALYGYMFLVFTALTLPFLKELVRAFGRSFLNIRHTFAAVGLALITLHPILFAFESSAISVFIPSFSSWLIFWTFGGQVALPILYVGFVAALLRKKAVTKWRSFHMLIYVALFFGFVHANLLGLSFYGSMGIVAIYDILFAASVGAFAFRRYQNYHIRKKMRERSLTSKA